MKAVVLSKENKECIVLADDESMHTIPATITGRQELNVGDVFELAPYVRTERPVRRQAYRIVAAAAVFLIAVFGAFYYTTFTVSATVTTEGEAPITYYLNHWGKVLRAQPQNEAAKAVLEDMGDLGTRPDLEEVLEKTAASMQKQGILGEEEEMTYTVDKGNDGKIDERGSVSPSKDPETTGPTYGPAPAEHKEGSDKDGKDKKTTEKRKPTRPSDSSTEPSPTEPSPAPTDPAPAPTDPAPTPPDESGGGDEGGDGGGEKSTKASVNDAYPDKPDKPDKPNKTDKSDKADKPDGTEE